MLAIAAMRGSSASTVAASTTAIRPVAIMCGALEQDSKSADADLF